MKPELIALVQELKIPLLTADEQAALTGLQKEWERWRQHELEHMPLKMEAHQKAAYAEFLDNPTAENGGCGHQLVLPAELGRANWQSIAAANGGLPVRRFDNGGRTMMTLEHRLATIVNLLPPSDKARFTAPGKPKEGTDVRLAAAIRALAESEGLVCMTPPEFARAVLKKAVERGLAGGNEAASAPAKNSLAARFAAISDPRAQTAFWRSLTVVERAEILKAG